MDDKKIGLYDEDIIVDDGHDTAKELSLKEHQKTLAQWQEKIRQRREKQQKQGNSGGEKPSFEHAKEDEPERTRNGV